MSPRDYRKRHSCDLELVESVQLQVRRPPQGEACSSLHGEMIGVIRWLIRKYQILRLGMETECLPDC